MSFDNVLRRYCDPQDFANSYKSLCGLQDSIPINIVRSHIKNREFELNADKVRIFDWPPVINAIKFDCSLEKISVFSIYKHHLKTRRKTLRFKMNCPAIHTREVSRRMAVAISNCLKKSEQISKLELQGIPFSEKDLLIISNGISKNESLTHLSIDYCPISDRGLSSICKSLGKHPAVTKITFNGCNLSASSAQEVSALLHQQLLTHHTQRWAESLRYRTPDLRRMGGIRRVSLNANPAIGDAGIAPLCDILPQDLWIKAIDLQGCGITDEGAGALYKSIESNQTLVVLDVRNNPMVSERKVRDILASILLNGGQSHDEIEYPWEKHSYPKLNHLTNQRRKPNISKVRSTYMPPGGAVARKEQSNTGNKQRGSQIRAQKVLPSTTNVSQANVSRNRAHGCVHKNSRCNRHIKMLEEQVSDMKRKLQLADDLEKALKEMVINLETDNFELRHQLNETEENMTIKSRLSDETLLENVEQSFNKFHEFLDKLHDVGLGSLVAQSGLDVGVGCLDNLSSLSSINDKPAGGDAESPQYETTQSPIVIDNSTKRREHAIGDDTTLSGADATKEGVAEKGDSPSSKEDAQVTELPKDEETKESSDGKVKTKGESVDFSAIKEETKSSSLSSSSSDYSDSFTQGSITTPTFSTSNS